MALRLLRLSGTLTTMLGEIKTRKLTSYVLSDVELDEKTATEESSKPESSKPEGDKANPDTGR